MIILSVALILFIFLETLNIFLLYKAPGSRRGNAVGVFKAFEKTRQDPDIRDFVDYLIAWVAGTKLIFVVLIIGIVITGSVETKVFSVIALILSIGTFYVRLHPILKKIDSRNQLEPKGYARSLALMIGSFMSVFAAALAVFFFTR